MALNLSNVPEGLTGDELAKRLTDDVREVFSTMVGMGDLLHPPKQIDTMTQFESCVTAMVGLAGSYNGMVCLHAPLRQGLAITAGMLGVGVCEFNEDVRDALGEVANMIAGSFKQHLSRGGGRHTAFHPIRDHRQRLSGRPAEPRRHHHASLRHRYGLVRGEHCP